jgi:hypothetical protein
MAFDAGATRPQKPLQDNPKLEAVVVYSEAFPPLMMCLERPLTSDEIDFFDCLFSNETVSRFLIVHDYSDTPGFWKTFMKDFNIDIVKT